VLLLNTFNAFPLPRPSRLTPLRLSSTKLIGRSAIFFLDANEDEDEDEDEEEEEEEEEKKDDDDEIVAEACAA